MARSDGFDVMDVSTNLLNDPKFKQLQRVAPEHVAPGFMAYVATMAESWRVGRRVSVIDAWPAILPFAEPIVGSLKDARLLDKTGQVPAKTWKGWFEPAKTRRDRSRERWGRYNDKRDKSGSDDHGGTTRPNGRDDAGTAR